MNTHTLRIDWSELDYFGHVNNVSFYKYIQSARVHFWDRIGLTRWHLDTRQGPMLLSCSCRFKKPLFYPGTVRIETCVAYLRNTSFSFEHTLYDSHGDCVAEATDVMVMYDFNTDQKLPIPEPFRKDMETLQTDDGKE